MRTGRSGSWIVAVGLLVALFTASGVGARATYGAQTSVDEPQYLITALSLLEDADLDISDELAEEAFRPFHDLPLNEQTAPVDEAGRRFSPHDPLLPALLVPGMAVGGWVGAKVTLALLAGLTAAATAWLAHRRFGVSPVVAAVVVGGFGISMPLVAYGTQVYPELPAALFTVVAVGAATASRLAPRHLVIVAISVIALPWLAVKYVPVAAAIALLTLWRAWNDDESRSLVTPMLGFLAVAGAVYAIVHQRIYGGWTVYAAGDHFVESGELSVVGVDPDYLGRSRRLVGLLVDRRFGLLPWSPIWLLAPFGAALIARSRAVGLRARGNRAMLLAPLAAGWLTATFVALTMHGFWSPGRQIVVVAPLAAIGTAVLVERFRRWLVPAALLGIIGATNWLVLAWEATTDRRTIAVDFSETAAPGYRAVSPLMPDGVRGDLVDDAGLIVWAVLIAAGIAWMLMGIRREGVAGSGAEEVVDVVGRRLGEEPPT